MARLELAEPGRWVMKGAMVLEVRLGDRARFTRDLDLVARSVNDPTHIGDLLRLGLAQDVAGDGFSFRLGQRTELDVDEVDLPTWRFRLDADLAERPFDATHIDVVMRAGEIGLTERVQLPDRLGFAEIGTTEVETINRQQHFAEKLHAFTRSYQGRPSSRVRDLPDMLLLIEDGLKSSAELHRVVATVFDLRGTHPLPRQLPAMPETPWRAGYARIAQELQLAEQNLDGAIQQLQSFWNSVLASRQGEE